MNVAIARCRLLRPNTEQYKCAPFGRRQANPHRTAKSLWIAHSVIGRHQQDHALRVCLKSCKCCDGSCWSGVAGKGLKNDTSSRLANGAQLFGNSETMLSTRDYDQWGE